MHPTKLVKAASCCLLSPLMTTTGGKCIYNENLEMKNKNKNYHNEEKRN